MKGSTNDPFDQGSNQMYTIQAFIVFGTCAEVNFFMSTLNIFNEIVASPRIGGNRAARFNIVKDEGL